MKMRVGKVTNIYPNTGKVKVVYEDENNASLKLSMITMNQEYLMPQVGDKVLTMHMENGSSKGFVIGTYYGGGMQPKANSGYRKDFGGGAFTTCQSGVYRLSAGSINLLGGGASLSLKGNAGLIGDEVVIGSAAASEDENTEEVEPDVFLKIMDKEVELKAVLKISVIAESGPVEITNEEAEAHLLLDAESELKAVTLLIEADNLTFRCSYGEETFENILKRIERIEDQLGLPHTI